MKAHRSVNVSRLITSQYEKCSEHATNALELGVHHYTKDVVRQRRSKASLESQRWLFGRKLLLGMIDETVISS